MTGVASDAGVADMILPVGVKVTGHLQHAPGNHLGVAVVGGHVGAMAIVATLVGRSHPLRDREHHAGELRDIQILEDLYVLVDAARERAVGRRGRNGRRQDVLRGLHGIQSGIDHRIHSRTAKSPLQRFDRGALAAPQQNDAGDQREFTD